MIGREQVWLDKLLHEFAASPQDYQTDIVVEKREEDTSRLDEILGWCRHISLLADELSYPHSNSAFEILKYGMTKERK